MRLDYIAENFYNTSIKKYMPKCYSSNEHDFASRIFKSVSYTIWSDNMMSLEQKLEYLNGYNKSNIIEMLIEVIEVIKTYNIKKAIMPRDLTSVPSDWIFYNQKIKHLNNGREMLTLFKTIKVFSSGKLKVGFQSGIKNEIGESILEDYDKSVFDKDKCYVMLSFKETTDLSTNKTEEHIFLDYYLGNDSFE